MTVGGTTSFSSVARAAERACWMSWCFGCLMAALRMASASAGEMVAADMSVAEGSAGAASNEHPMKHACVNSCALNISVFY